MTQYLYMLPVDGVWSEWQTVSSGPCSASCGGGVRETVLQRTCIGPMFGGRDCQGDTKTTKSKQCNTQPCSGIICQKCMKC